MSIRSLPVSLDTAASMRKVLRSVRSDSRFSIVGVGTKGKDFYVREVHPSGRIEMHGKEQGYAVTSQSKARKSREAAATAPDRPRVLTPKDNEELKDAMEARQDLESLARHAAGQ